MARRRQARWRGDRRAWASAAHPRRRRAGAAKRRLNITQSLATGRAKLDGIAQAELKSLRIERRGGELIEEDIKAERLRRLRHLNKRAAEEAALRAGVYVKAADAQQQFGAVAARMLCAFEASFTPIANAIVASRAQTPYDILRTMRSTWREVRAQAANAQGEEAMPCRRWSTSDTDAAFER